ncbi:MAG: ZIP family metal transporter [Reyranellaceae bacterium]
MMLDPKAIAILLLSLLSVVTTAIGVILALAIRENRSAIAVGIGFSTSIMVFVSVFELVPEAAASIGPLRSGASLGLGAAVLWAANLLVPHVHLVREHGQVDTRLVRSVYLVVIGLVLHDVPEGFAMANAYVASSSLGLLVALAIALHNLPEELAMAVPAIALRDPRFLMGAAALSALAEPAGAILGLLAVQASPGLNGYFLAFAAGAMLFVSLHELVPMARRYGKMAWFGAGIGLGIVVHQLLAFAITR